MTPRATLPLLVLLALPACSDLATSPDRQPARLRLTPNPVVATAGDSIAFDLQVLDQHGDPFAEIPGWSPPEWTSSHPELLSVVPGLGEALNPGQGWVRVEVAGLYVESRVRTNPVTLTVNVPSVHLTQSVQTMGGDVPLVAGRSALVRAFVTGGGANFFQPRVQATFHREGAVVHTQDLELRGAGLPTRAYPLNRGLTYEATVPGLVLQPGTALSVEVDPEGVVPSTSESVLRWPAQGTAALDVREVIPFRVRLVPIQLGEGGDVSSFDQYSGPARTGLARSIFPFQEFAVDVRQPYTTSADLSIAEGWYDLSLEIFYIRLDDGRPDYYYGGFKLPEDSDILGLGYLGYPVAIGTDEDPLVIAHELGHTLSLRHAPCGGPASTDGFYPHEAGLTGALGFDAGQNRILDPANHYDLMSYCEPRWISDYHYERVLFYRSVSQYDSAFIAGYEAPPAEDVLVVTGVLRDGELSLDLVLPSHSRPFQTGPGAYTLEGRDGAGGLLFSRSLAPMPLATGGAQAFMAVIPASEARPDVLARLRLTGPEGTAERVRSQGPTLAPREIRADAAGVGSRFRWDPGAYPVAVARSAATGEVVAIARDGRLDLPAGLDVEISLSDGLESRPARVLRP